MKNMLAFVALTSLTSFTAVADSYSKNPVLRPLTLDARMAQLTGVFTAGEARDKSDSTFDLNFAYGLTEDVTLGFGGVRYRFQAREYNHTGLEMAVSLGKRAHYDSIYNGEVDAYGVDLMGKYVVSDEFAWTFGFGSSIWVEDILANKNEYNASVGIIKRLSDEWTFAGNYTYRGLDGFVQDDADQVNASLTYNYSKNIDIGLFAHYTSFDAVKNGYRSKHKFEESVGVYASWRF